MTQLQERRMEIPRDALNGRSFVLCIDETGCQKYGAVTDYVSRHSIGNVEAIETGLVSVNAYPAKSTEYIKVVLLADLGLLGLLDDPVVVAR